MELGGGMGMSTLGLRLHGVYLLQEGIFLTASLFFFFGLERNTGAQSQRYQKAMADLKNPATGDLLPSIFSKRDVWGLVSCTLLP